MDTDKEPNYESIDLPPVVPVEAQAEQSIIQQQGTERNPELLPTSTSSSSVKPADTPNTISSSAIPAASTTQSPATPAPTYANTDDFIADDTDLIEKEWVERAKEIVHKTKDNPYLQNKAIAKMKADYIKKRYNKDLRVQED